MRQAGPALVLTCGRHAAQLPHLPCRSYTQAQLWDVQQGLELQRQGAHSDEGGGGVQHPHEQQHARQPAGRSQQLDGAAGAGPPPPSPFPVAEPAAPLPLPLPYFCVLYTSGSTGAPLGVQLSEAAFLSRVAWMQASWPLLAPGAVVCFATPVSFVDHLWQLLAPLMAGAGRAEEEGGSSGGAAGGGPCSVVVPPTGAVLEPGFVELLAQHGVTHLVRRVEGSRTAGALMKAVVLARLIALRACVRVCVWKRGGRRGRRRRG